MMQLNQYALPAVNVTSTSTVNTVLETATELNSPVIIQFSAGGCQFYISKGLKDDNFVASINGGISGFSCPSNGQSIWSNCNITY